MLQENQEYLPKIPIAHQMSVTEMLPISSNLQAGKPDSVFVESKRLIAICLTIAAFEFLCLYLEYDDFGNRAGPILLTISFIWASVRTVLSCYTMLLTSLPWILLSAAMYFGLGPLVLCYGTDTSINSYDYMAIDSTELLRTNILNITFLFLYLLSYIHCIGRRSISLKTLQANLDDKRPAITVIWGCVAIGVPVRLFLCMPYEFGLLDYPLPGAIFQLGNLVTICLIPLWYLVGSGDRKYLSLAVFLLLLELSFGILTFSKSTLLIAIVFASIGLIVSKRSLSVLCVGAIAVLIPYFVVAPIITNSREQRNLIGFEQNTSLTSELAVRYGVMLAVITDEGQVRTRRIDPEMQEGWLRLNYSNAQSWVMSRYDQGQPFDFYKNAAWVIVPRILVPFKPNMTAIGTDLNEMIHGRTSSSMAVGIAAEAYGVYGPAGVCIVALLIGFLMAYLDSSYTFWSASWLFLPVQIMILRMGYRLDGLLIPDYLGTLVMIEAYAFVIKRFEALFAVKT